LEDVNDDDAAWLKAALHWSNALDNLNSLDSVFPSIITYLRNVRNISPARGAEIGHKVLRLLDDSLISELDYHRMWALDLFTHSIEWDNENEFFAHLADARDQLSRRKLILAMGPDSDTGSSRNGGTSLKNLHGHVDHS
jgi:hypothetical protein